MQTIADQRYGELSHQGASRDGIDNRALARSVRYAVGDPGVDRVEVVQRLVEIVAVFYRPDRGQPFFSPLDPCLGLAAE